MRDLVMPFTVLWVVSFIHLLTALSGGQTFGAIDTLATMALVFLPCALARGRVRMR